MDELSGDLVLIVDDIETNIDILVETLCDDYEIMVATNGFEAVELTNTFSPDLILLDVMMPEMDGFEVCKRIKENEATKDIPIIFVTAKNEIVDETRGFEVGAADYITKPVNPSIVKARVAVHLELKRKREELVKKNQLLQQEKEKTERLLLNILPGSIVKRLEDGEEIIADKFDEASILFADIVGFTSFSATISAKELVSFLNNIWSKFDRLTDKYKVEKIKTLGDGYIVAAGLPERSSNHAEILADVALEMKTIIDSIRTREKEFKLRMGINTGTVVAGVIGEKKFVYDLWGDTVNTAQRMEAHSEPGEIQITSSTYKLLKDKYIIEKRGLVEIKGKGKMEVYYLKGKKPEIQ